MRRGPWPVWPRAGGSFAACGRQFALAGLDLLVDLVQVRLVLAAVVGHPAVAHFHDAGGHALREVPVVAGEDDRPLVLQQGLGQRLDGIDVEMVARLVEDQHVVIAQQQPRQAEPGPLAAGQHGDRLLDMRLAEQQRAGHFEDLLVLLAAARLAAARYSSTVCFSGRLV